MAPFDVGRVLSRIATVNSHRCVPHIRYGHEVRIDRGSQLRNQIRQWIAEIFVLSTSETVAFHHHAAAKDLFLFVEGTNAVAFTRRQQALYDRVTFRVEIVGDLSPDGCRGMRHVEQNSSDTSCVTLRFLLSN